MQSARPLPGMDPWLERTWGDVHGSLIAAIRSGLNAVLPPKLAARAEERVYVESPIDPDRLVVPDVRIVEFPRSPRRPAAGAGGASAGLVVAEEVTIDFRPLELVERFIEIRDYEAGGKLVTLIEVVSLANKASGDGRRQYLRKQSEVVAAGCNLVEIDLLRSGRGVTLAAQRFMPAGVGSEYHVSVFRAARKEQLGLVTLPLRDALPGVRIPLRPHDEDVLLDLGALLEQVYVDGRYDATIDYARDPVPPLPSDDREWAAARVRDWEAGLTTG